MHYLAYTTSRVLANNPTHFDARRRHLFGHAFETVQPAEKLTVELALPQDGVRAQERVGVSVKHRDFVYERQCTVH